MSEFLPEYYYGSHPETDHLDNRRQAPEREPGKPAETDVMQHWSAGVSALGELDQLIGKLEKVRHVDKAGVWFSTPESRQVRHLHHHLQVFVNRLGVL